jgi:hypothetical protein
LPEVVKAGFAESEILTTGKSIRVRSILEHGDECCVTSITISVLFTMTYVYQQQKFLCRYALRMIYHLPFWQQKYIINMFRHKTRVCHEEAGYECKPGAVQKGWLTEGFSVAEQSYGNRQAA